MCVLNNQIVSILTIVVSFTSVLLTGRVGLVENRTNESKNANYSTDYSEEELGHFMERPCTNVTALLLLSQAHQICHVPFQIPREFTFSMDLITQGMSTALRVNTEGEK